MQSYIKRAAALTLSGLMVCGLMTGCGKKEEDTKIDGTKTLLTVNDETVSLGVGSFMARYSQAQIYQFYTAYFGSGMSLFDSAAHEGSDETYGEHLKESVISDLEKDVVMRQHAEEYGVSLTDEETAAIEAAADAYIEKNDEEVLEKIGASREDLVELMTLQTYQAKMMDPIVADVDTEVSDEEGQVSSLTYIAVPVPEDTGVDSGAESAVTVVEPVADTESTASSGAESVAEEMPETAQMLEAKAKAEHIIEHLLEEENIAEADMDAVAQHVDESYNALQGQFTTYDTADATVDAAIVAAVQDLEDGTLVETPILSEDGTEYYVVRFDKAYDEELTESNKAEIVEARKQTLYDETTDGWVEEAEITVDEDAWSAVVLTDSVPFTLAYPETEEVETESGAESMTSVVEVESIAEPVEDAVTETISMVEETVSAVESMAEEAMSAAE